ncbi:MAG: hypothetical protein ACXWDN_18540 [Limisphaerales bacterium]
MNFDAYWKNLIHRVHKRGEALAGAEETVYRLTCIYGETMVDGVEAYFERRFQEYDLDMARLRNCGFEQIASDYSEAKHLLFGAAPLSEAVVVPIIDRLLDGKEDDRATLAALGTIYDRLIARLPLVLAYRDRYARESQLYEEAEPGAAPNAAPPNL